MINDRQKKIFELVQQKGKISVNKLSQTLYVSQMTIRRDLVQLEKEGLLNRYRGGAVSKIDEGELPISQRMVVGENEKRELGKKAEKYLRDNIHVYIDSSSTCAYIIPYLKNYKNVHLITNSVKSLIYASQYHIPTTLIGGNYDEQDMCLVGPSAAKQASQINVDIAFFSTMAYSDDGIISDENQEQIEVRKSIMKNAGKIIFLFETRKLHKKAFYTLCTKEDLFDLLVPDSDF